MRTIFIERLKIDAKIVHIKNSNVKYVESFLQKNG